MKYIPLLIVLFLAACASGAPNAVDPNAQLAYAAADITLTAQSIGAHVRQETQAAKATDQYVSIQGTSLAQFSTLQTAMVQATLQAADNQRTAEAAFIAGSAAQGTGTAIVQQAYATQDSRQATQAAIPLIAQLTAQAAQEQARAAAASLEAQTRRTDQITTALSAFLWLFLLSVWALTMMLFWQIAAQARRIVKARADLAEAEAWRKATTQIPQIGLVILGENPRLLPLPGMSHQTGPVMTTPLIAQTLEPLEPAARIEPDELLKFLEATAKLVTWEGDYIPHWDKYPALGGEWIDFNYYRWNKLVDELIIEGWVIKNHGTRTKTTGDMTIRSMYDELTADNPPITITYPLKRPVASSK